MKKTIKLTKEEKEILKMVEGGEFAPVPSRGKAIGHYAKAAKATSAKNKTISIRVSAVDLMKLKTKALQEGLPYQSLIAASIHKLTA